MKRQIAKHMEEDIGDIPMSYLVYVVLGLVAIIAGVAIMIVRMLPHP
jgi:hypothetical protein